MEEKLLKTKNFRLKTSYLGVKSLTAFFFLLFLSFTSLILGFGTAYAQDASVIGPKETPATVPGILIPNHAVGNRIIYPGNENVNVVARVGEYVVNITGMASPNASVVLQNEEGEFIRSTVANTEGYFSITELSVKNGFDGFCLESIDFKRLGNSVACLDFEPITQNEDYENIYLPPTIGLFSKQINAGSQALIYGYSMPGAEVDVRVKDGVTFAVTADGAGYYEYRFQEVPAGKYQLSSIAQLDSQDSLEPVSSVELEALSLPDQVARTTGDVVTDTGNLLTTTIVGFLLIIFLLILIIILILIFIFKPTWAAFIWDHFEKKYPMHHDWLIDFIENYEEKTNSYK